MTSQDGWLRILHRWLRPGFGAALFLSQFTSRRGSFLTGNAVLLAAGVGVTLAGIGLMVWASVHLQRAQRSGTFATTGPYRRVRHPIYAGINVFSIGLGLIFFAWAWFVVLVLFAPLWWLECRAEEAEMQAAYGEAYRVYQARTHMAIPGLV